MRRAGRPLVALLGLLASGATASAQTAGDAQLWLNATLFGSVGSFAYFAEVQPRFGEDVSRLNQMLLRPAVGWKLGEGLAVYQGYARVETSPADARATTEDRSFQQLTWELGRFGGVKVWSRTRFEQRRLSDGRDTGLRLREQLGASHPLTSGGDVSLLGWVETFVALNDTDWGARAGFDQVRTFVGLEIPVQGQSTVEIGYLNQTINVPAGRTAVNHVLSLNIFLRP